MTINYDGIAREYQEAKQQPWRLHVECYTFLQVIGDLHGKEVLELACGEGFYTRALKRGGAARVVGVDLSAGMIDLARGQETQQPLGIEYHVGDARQVNLGQFELVAAAFLLNYARTRDELLDMCRAVARSLKPGGRFVTVNANPDFPATHNHTIRKYGFERISAAAMNEGDAYNWRIYLPDATIDVTNFYLSTATHDWALRTAGFQEIRYHAAQLAPAVAKEREFYRAFLESSPVVFMECWR